MKITKEQITDVTAVLNVTIEKADYAEKVEQALNNYRKNANIPGFRKGHVPMGMVKKQYGRAIQVDEINKLIQNGINDYIVKEKLDILGNPLPKQADVDWDAEAIVFNFDLGLAPKFEVNLSPTEAFKLYEISTNSTEIDEQVNRILSEQGELVPAEKVSDNSEISAIFFNEEKNIDKNYTFSTNSLTKEALDNLLNREKGEQLTLSTKGLFKDDHMLMHALGVSHDEVHQLDIQVTLTIDTINEVKPAQMNEDFFKKISPDGEVASEQDLRAKIEESLKEQYTNFAEQRFLDDVTNALIENTPMELPEEFLKRWLKTAGEKELTDEEAVKEFERSEKGLRYQLIENKIVSDNNINVTQEELQNYAENTVRQYFRSYGIAEPSQEQLKNFTSNILNNGNERERIFREILGKKLLDFYKENAKIDKKAVSFKEFEEIAFSK